MLDFPPIIGGILPIWILQSIIYLRVFICITGDGQQIGRPSKIRISGRRAPNEVSWGGHSQKTDHTSSTGRQKKDGDFIFRGKETIGGSKSSFTGREIEG